jgi:hypothetical protein
VVTRHYRVEERDLVIELEVMNKGERVRRTLRWERVG